MTLPSPKKNHQSPSNDDAPESFVRPKRLEMLPSSVQNTLIANDFALMFTGFHRWVRDRNLKFATEDEFVWAFTGFVWSMLEERRRHWQEVLASEGPPEDPMSSETSDVMTESDSEDDMTQDDTRPSSPSGSSSS